MASVDKVSGHCNSKETQFNHSAKPPKNSKLASKILKEVSEKKCSFKTSLYRGKNNQRRSAYALVTETMKYNSILDSLIDSAGICDDGRADRYLAKILIYELMFGKRKQLLGCSKPVLKIIEAQPLLNKCLNGLLEKSKAKSVLDLLVTVTLPLYVRINTLKTNIDKIIHFMGKQDFEEITYDKGTTTYEGFLKLVKSLKPKTFLRDFHVDEVLVFPTGTPIPQYKPHKNGELLLQDKASCFAPILLNPAPGSVVIDACASPGMKTSLLAALMQNSGKLLAVERDMERMKTLKQTQSVAGVICATFYRNDFTNIDPNSSPFCDAEYILVDPSCSGSGMVTRLQERAVTKTDESTERISALACFQAKILRHALSFPKVKRVVYSTCSFSHEENEAVIAEALSFYEGIFHLVQALPEWPTRGLTHTFENMKLAVRTTPDDDLVGGFFVAVLERNVDEEGCVHEDTKLADDSEEEKSENEGRSPLKRKKKSEQDDGCNKKKKMKSCEAKVSGDEECSQQKKQMKRQQKKQMKRQQRRKKSQQN